MIEFVNPRLAAWENYYVIVGGAAAALISVQFVVIALISNRRLLVSEETINAFGTPTVVHLGGALIVSAIMCAPFASAVRHLCCPDARRAVSRPGEADAAVPHRRRGSHSAARWNPQRLGLGDTPRHSGRREVGER